MKRLKNFSGGRGLYIDDFQVLQEQIDVFKNKGYKGLTAFVASGCIVTGNSIGEGIVWINDKLIYFAGASSVSFPTYLHEVAETELGFERFYNLDDTLKKAYAQTNAALSASAPASGQYITFTNAGARNFFTVIEEQLDLINRLADKSNVGHEHNAADIAESSVKRFITDGERNTWNGKQNALTFDNSPNNGSSNPVTSGGIYTAIQNAITTIVNGAPNALDTLLELATALGNDASFATNVTNALAARILISSIVNDLNSTAANQPLSANMGKYLHNNKANIAQAGWTDLPLNTGWTQAPGYTRPQYRINTIGRLEMRGAAARAVGASDIIGTLSVGVQVGGDQAFPVLIDRSLSYIPSYWVYINQYGQIKWAGSNDFSLVYLQLDAVSFSVT